MTTSKVSGHKLADGTYSGQYKIGDKFVVTDSQSWDRKHFTKGSLVELIREEHTTMPLFKLLDGQCGYDNAPNRTKGAFTMWEWISAYKPTTELQQLINQSKELLERIEELTKKEEAAKVTIDVVKQRIQTELDLAKAKRERLSAHIEILERKLAE